MTQNNQKIPEGWSVKKLGKVINTFSGGTPLAGNPVYYEKGTIPFIRSGEIYQDYTELFITEKGLQESSAKMVNKGDLLFALYGANSGEIAISKIKGAINQAILCIRPKEDDINYLKNLFIFLKNRILHKYLQGGQGNLSAEIVKSLNFLLPPLAEQEKIAEILCTWDEAIEKLSGLIEQKKLLKKGLMQKLLTSKTRLPGFTQPWKEKKLGDLTCEISKSVGDLNIQTASISAKVGFVSQTEKFGRDISGAQYNKYTLIEKGDFSYNKGNSKTYPQGCAYRLKDFEMIAVPNVFISFRVKENILHPGFIEQFFIGNFHGKLLRKVITSSVRDNGLLNLSVKDFFGIPINLPTDIKEQQAIADVLSAADDEINLLNQKLEALKAQKKGLMQKLLTGQIRVKVN